MKTAVRYYTQSGNTKKLAEEIESTYKQMKTVAAGAGVTLSEQEFHCRGKFKALHSGHPDEEDLKAARAFAKKVAG